MPEDVDLHTVLTQSSKAFKVGDTSHIDKLSPHAFDINIDNLKQRFRPFDTPHAPVPLESLDAEDPTRVAKARRQPTTHKAYSMMVNILESTDANGQTSYSASASDVYEEPSPIHATAAFSSLPKQPFLGRMQRRQRRTWQIREQGPHRGVWRLISVKRQRKLKMKKHKYKKLMKRTRTLRRKLERG